MEINWWLSENQLVIKQLVKQWFNNELMMIWQIFNGDFDDDLNNSLGNDFTSNS